MSADVNVIAPREVSSPTSPQEQKRSREHVAPTAHVIASAFALRCRISRTRWRYPKQRDGDASAPRRINLGGTPVLGQTDNERSSSPTYATATPGGSGDRCRDRASPVPRERRRLSRPAVDCSGHAI